MGPNGGTPDIAVDDIGRAHIVWDDAGPDPDVVRYCRLARGAGACTDPETFSTTPTVIQGRPHVFAPSSNEVIVLYKRCCGGSDGTRELYSSDNGANFIAESIIGTDPNFAVSEAIFGPAPGYSYTSLAENITGGARVQSTAFGSTTAASANLGTASSAEGAIGVDAGGRPVAVYQLQTTPWRLTWRKLMNSATVSRDNINNLANWTAAATISDDRIDASTGPALASGSSGLFLFWQKRQPDQGFVSKFNGTDSGTRRSRSLPASPSTTSTSTRTQAGACTPFGAPTTRAPCAIAGPTTGG